MTSGKLFTISDSVCVKLISSNSLLFGLGHQLRYCYKDGNETKIINLSNRLHDKVQGICLDSDPNGPVGDVINILTYGGREYQLFQLNEIKQEIKCVFQGQITDWISSVIFYPNENISIGLLTGRSLALNIEIDLNKGESRTVNRCPGPDPATLYCSRLSGTNWMSTLVFTGTALGLLVIWKITDPDPDGKADLLYSINCHNGVIFSIDFSIHYKIITTTSDDRSLKIWNVAGDWERIDSLKCDLTLFGHVARVFQHKIITEPVSNRLLVITVGEDGNVCLWTIDGGLLHKFSLPNCSTIWNLDFDSNRQIIYVSTADGNIRTISIRDSVKKGTEEKSIRLTDPLRSEFITKIRILNDRTVVGLTNFNRLFCSSNLGGDSLEFSGEIVPFTSVFFESLQRKIAVGGYRSVIIYEFLSDQPDMLYSNFQLGTEIIRSINFLSANEILASNQTGECFLIDTLDGCILYFNIPPCKERWVTSALKLHEKILVSDRCGNVHLYSQRNGELSILFTLKHVHGYLGCTQLLPYTIYDVVSAGHDGSLKYLNITDDKLSIAVTQKIPILWIDRLINGHLVAGFNGKHFLIVDIKTMDRSFEYSCGGGHRYWDLSIDRNGFGGYFYFIRQQIIHRIEFKSNKNRNENIIEIPINNWHTKSCNTIVPIEHNGTLIIVSGGDDNLLKFHRYSFNKLENLIECSTHISNIRTIAVYSLRRDDWIVISAGGRAQLCISKLTFENQFYRIVELKQFLLKSDRIKSTKIDCNPETRFMSCCLLKSNLTEIKLMVACSDGFIRKFNYSFVNNEIDVESIRFYGRCLLTITSLTDKIILTSSTDGKINFWDVNDMNESLFCLHHHNGGVNCIDTLLDIGSVHILTGGDDQSVILSQLEIKSDQTICLLNTKKFYNHTAQVTGVKFDLKRKCYYSTGCDQTVWKGSLIDDTSEKIFDSSVSDVKGLGFYTPTERKSVGDSIIIYGCGVEILEI